VQPHPAEVLIVVNASGGWNDRKPVGHGGFAQEFAGVKRSLDVQYDMSTAHRKRALYAMFRDADEDGKAGAGLAGLFAQITDSPYRIITKCEGHSDEMGARARTARAFLDGCGYTFDQWEGLTKQTRGIATTLAALGPADTAKLLEHGYVLTMVNSFVVQNLGKLLPVNSAKFEAICS
jgi:hypothetical protein